MSSRCASCGTAENDDIKLKKCTACYLVRYCGVKCQKDHWKKHKEECRKRAAELRDELLFKQPESSHFGDCPICCVPLPLDFDKSIVLACCNKSICNGCRFANEMRELEGRLQSTCIFCRHPTPESRTEADTVLMKRVQANDPVAIREMGNLRSVEGDYKGAIELWTKAAKLNDAVAHYQLSCMHQNGVGVEKDEKKEAYHLEQAAIGGHVGARFNLGCLEWNNGRKERSIKHFTTAANLGDVESMEQVKKSYQAGLASKDDFASTLRAHHAAVDAMKSPEREAAEAAARTMS